MHSWVGKLGIQFSKSNKNEVLLCGWYRAGWHCDVGGLCSASTFESGGKKTANNKLLFAHMSAALVGISWFSKYHFSKIHLFSLQCCSFSTKKSLGSQHGNVKGWNNELMGQLG